MQSLPNNSQRPELGPSREKALIKNRRLDIMMGILFIVQGIGAALVEVLPDDTANVLNTLLIPVFFLLLVVIVIQGRAFLKHKLAPQDEYEVHQDAIVKAKAFNYLSGGLFFIMILIPGVFAMPAVSILLGVTWLTVVYSEKDAKQTAQ